MIIATSLALCGQRASLAERIIARFVRADHYVVGGWRSGTHNKTPPNALVAAIHVGDLGKDRFGQPANDHATDDRTAVINCSRAAHLVRGQVRSDAGQQAPNLG
ncbi:hypothetical protein [Allorhizocola rhizosphaerae]|uniref:hypothetical protein n=1 Tax=Allorhizocola rhizosphaerae TaxID=1872709 RepID=UPI0013C308DE|nr:hypothetical protein [Allorhizocola rhizosphaerae]